MKYIRLVLGALALSAVLLAQDPVQDPTQSQRDRLKTDTTITGCLSKDSSGTYVLADESTGVKTTVTGTADLEKHSANHKVTLTGATKTDANGKTVFEATKLQHLSDTCKAP